LGSPFRFFLLSQQFLLHDPFQRICRADLSGIQPKQSVAEQVNGAAQKNRPVLSYLQFEAITDFETSGAKYEFSDLGGFLVAIQTFVRSREKFSCYMYFRRVNHIANTFIARYLPK